MRQAGFLAATAMYALDHHIERLAIDHHHARLIEAALQKHPLVKTVMPVETNLIIFEMKEGVSPANFIARMKEKEILFLPISKSKLRMVTHLDITSDMVEFVESPSLSQLPVNHSHIHFHLQIRAKEEETVPEVSPESLIKARLINDW